MFSSNKLFVALILVLVAALSLGAGQPVRAAATVKTISIDSKSVTMSLSPDGRTLAVFELGALYNDVPDPEHLPIHLFDVASGKELRQLTDFSDYVGSVAFTPDGKRLASYHNNGVLYVWDVATGKALKQINAFLASSKIKFLPDGKTLAVLISGTPPKILLWDTGSGAITSVLGPRFDSRKAFTDTMGQPLATTSMIMTALDVSPDGKMLATATASDQVDLWDVATNDVTTLRPESDKKGTFSIRGLSFVDNGKSLAYYEMSTKTTHIWDVSKMDETQSLTGGSPAFAISPKGDILAWAEGKSDASKIRMVRLAQPDQPVDLADIAPSLLVVLPTSAAFTPDGRRFVVGGFAANDGKNVIYIVTLGQAA